MDIQMTKMMYQSMGIDEKVFDFGQKIAESLKERFEEILAKVKPLDSM